MSIRAAAVRLIDGGHWWRWAKADFQAGRKPPLL